jgi:spore maturation protein CgeB
MNITYIYHEYRNRRKRYADEMTKLGHKVSLLPVANKKAPGLITCQQIKDTKPDLLFLLSPFYIANKVITDEAIAWAKNRGTPIVCYSTLNTQVPFTEMNATWKAFDIFFAQQRQLTTHLKSIGVNAHYMPLGFYPDQYPPRRGAKTLPISFMGNPQTTVNGSDKRVEYVKTLAGRGIKVWGKAFNGKGIEAKAFNGHARQCEVYAQSKINLDLPFINSAHPFYANMYHLKNRFFEVPATQNFLLTAMCGEFTDILGEDMVGYYDDSPEGLRTAVHEYLGNDALRQGMATRAHVEVMAKHTFGHRFREMFRVLEV